MKVFVSGMGVISAIGQNVEENLQALKSGQTGIARSVGNGLMLGEVDLSNEKICHRFDLPDGEYSRTTLLGMMAAREAWGSNQQNERIRSGLISSTSTGGLDRMEKYYMQYQRDKSLDLPSVMTFENGRTTERIAQLLNINGYIDTISTACSSGANAIMYGARLIQSNILDRVVVGGVDCMTQYNMRGFSSLNIYDQELCRPFDESREGLNLGEGAAYLVLENKHSLSISKNTPLSEVVGWTNASDAFHQTASSAEGKGAALAMQGALAKAGIHPEEIGYLNAHGTGTRNNDLSESMAIKTVFGDAIPTFSSTKAFTGHTLAAAGAIEAVFCILSILNCAFLPNLNFSNPMKETGMRPVTTFESNGKISYALSNSFGFGGNCTSLIFHKV